MTRRDGTGREVGEGFRMGNTRTPVADSGRCVAEPIQYCKVKIKKKKKKKKNLSGGARNRSPFLVVIKYLFLKSVTP